MKRTVLLKYLKI